MFKFGMYKLGLFLTNLLSWPFSYRCATFISDCHYVLSFRDRWAVKNNLKVIFPDADPQDISRLTREVFRNFGRYLNEFFRMAKHINKEYVQKHIKVEHLKHILKALERGKGGIILTAHLGNWELGGVVLGILGYPVTAIALSHKERPVNELFNKQRAVQGFNVVPMNFAIRKCTELLKKNQLVAIAADRDFTQSGEEIDFLGRKTLIPKGAAMFSLRTGAAIIPTFFLRDKEEGQFVLSIEEPILPPLEVPREEEREEVLKLMKRYSKIIEDKIRTYPAQWLMFRPFWIQNSDVQPDIALPNTFLPRETVLQTRISE